MLVHVHTRLCLHIHCLSHSLCKLWAFICLPANKEKNGRCLPSRSIWWYLNSHSVVICDLMMLFPNKRWTKRFLPSANPAKQNSGIVNYEKVWCQLLSLAASCMFVRTSSWLTTIVIVSKRAIWRCFLTNGGQNTYIVFTEKSQATTKKGSVYIYIVIITFPLVHVYTHLCLHVHCLSHGLCKLWAFSCLPANKEKNRRCLLSRSIWWYLNSHYVVISDLMMLFPN
jgi:hypothetical protein